jgi:hypothetical protein
MAWKGIVGRHFTAAEFDGYVRGLTFGEWKPSFVVVHNTGAPTLAERPQTLNRTTATRWDGARGRIASSIRTACGLSRRSPKQVSTALRGTKFRGASKRLATTIRRRSRSRFGRISWRVWRRCTMLPGSIRRRFGCTRKIPKPRTGTALARRSSSRI